MPQIAHMDAIACSHVLAIAIPGNQSDVMTNLGYIGVTPSLRARQAARLVTTLHQYLTFRLTRATENHIWPFRSLPAPIILQPSLARHNACIPTSSRLSCTVRMAVRMASCIVLRTHCQGICPTDIALSEATISGTPLQAFEQGKPDVIVPDICQGVSARQLKRAVEDATLAAEKAASYASESNPTLTKELLEVIKHQAALMARFQRQIDETNARLTQTQKQLGQLVDCTPVCCELLALHICSTIEPLRF